MRLLQTALALLLITTFAPPSRALAWGREGHRAIARIAEARLSPEALRAARQLLGGRSLVEASTWADEVRRDPHWRPTSPWHYVNVEDDETYQNSPKNPGGDAIQALQRMREVLSDRSQPRRDRLRALRFVIHLVGDLHQPLHYGRRSDRGGNDVSVRWFGNNTNLHAVWDVGIVRSLAANDRLLAALAPIPGDEIALRWQKDPVLTWAEESFAYRHKLYQIGNGNLGRAYADEHAPFVKLRIAQAGVRLAAILEAALR
ncbi:MAG: S1/P1 nuclease [Bryobacterales bacterium]|nr:S1/P1 nuclease [Bryobacterales bacterium]